ncbi:pitrilysin family protein [Sphingomonas sp.]|uniref:M16 family metallopeptidase n=1 Tax=Sphingomonas sp. TaxID=28214 RepID=UPI0025ED561D|nr:pitrilysin family protein [Sphingomonas sp.]MBV9528937.1 insulinase family protein [Sphingomonas sp.]
MRIVSRLALLAAATALTSPAVAATPPQGVPVAALVKDVSIPYSTFTLKNGLRVVVHEDHKAPIVALSVWYHVGSKDEPAGRTGFAHLFEHLMFGGSQHSDTGWFGPMQSIGATDLNGTTNYDRTNYFETVPRAALERALFLESDRMGYLLPAMTQSKLDIQRGVVQNEKRGDDNQPGGLLQYSIQQTLFPAGNPYHHTVIGSMGDLDHASLEVVKDWFRSHYGPNNAVLVLAGDVTAADARPLVEKYFGSIPAGPKSTPAAATVPTLAAPVTKVFHDEVANTYLSRMWAVPGITAKDTAALEMAASILGGLSSSRLQNELVRDKKTAVSVSASVDPNERVGEFSIDATVRPGVDPKVVGQQLDAVVAEFIRSGPTAEELQRAKTADIASTIKGLESVGGFGGKAVTLAEGAVFANDPGFYKKELDEEAALTPTQVQAVARKWLSRPVFAYTLEPGAREAYEESKLAGDTAGGAAGAKVSAAPKAQVGAARGGIDRSALPPIATIGDLKWPAIEHATLSNGIPVVFARRADVPAVRVAVDFDAGNAADPKTALGTQAFMLGMLDEGTEKYNSVEIAEAKENLGASIGASPSMDRSHVYLSALKPNLAPSLDLLADIVRHPAFTPADVERVRAQQLSSIAEEAKQPVGIALRTLPPIIYGKDHPYGVPFSGSGDPAAVAKLTPADLAAFHDSWLRPDNATILVVGDTTLAEIMPLLERSFGDWRATGAKPVKNFAVPAAAQAGRILLIDRPNTPQSLIFAGELLPVRGTDDLVPLMEANDVLGGQFMSRLNMDLRETRHWSYGVQGFMPRPQQQVPYMIYAPVQTDQTGTSIAAMRDDITAFLAAKGVTPEELSRTIDGAVRELPGNFETGAALMGGIQNNLLYHRPDNYYETLASRYRSLTAPQLDAAAKAIDPSKFTWVVIGDAAKVKPQLAPLGLPVEVVQSK